MNSCLLFGLLLAHVISDFVLQNGSLAEKRISKQKRLYITANIFHAFIHFIITTAISVFYYASPWILLTGFFVFCTHFFIDIAKVVAIKKNPGLNNNIILFAGDQLLHIAVLFLISLLTDAIIAGSSGISYLIEVISQPGLYSWQYVLSGNRAVLFWILILTGIPAAGVFIKAFLEWLRYKPSKNRRIDGSAETDSKSQDSKGVFDGGYIIGILERSVIIFSIAVHMEAIIGFLIAVKSIARFKKFDDDIFVEYFIIGSFLSLLIAVLTGYLIRQLSLMPY